MLPFRVGVNTVATADSASSNSDIVFTKSDQNGNLKEFVSTSYLLGNFVTPRKSTLLRTIQQLSAPQPDLGVARLRK